MNCVFVYEFKKIIYNPASMIFRFVFPIGLFMLEHYVAKNSSSNELFSNIIVLSCIMFSLANISMTLNSDILEKRIKSLSLTNIKVFDYFSGLFIFNYLIYFIVFIVISFVSIYFFKMHLIWWKIIIIILFSIFIYWLHFMIALNLSLINNSKLCIIVSVLILYLLLFFSGSLIPISALGGWMMYIRYLTPTGCANIITSWILNPDFKENYIWLSFVIFFLYFLIFTFVAFKFWKWQ